MGKPKPEFLIPRFKSLSLFHLCHPKIMPINAGAHLRFVSIAYTLFPKLSWPHLLLVQKVSTPFPKFLGGPEH
jgi:hypothetical protein